MADSGIKIDLNRVAKLLDLTPYDDLRENNIDYLGDAQMAGREEALKDGATEADAEQAGYKAEEAAEAELYHNWHGAIERAAEELFGAHHLYLMPRRKGERYPFEYYLRPIRNATKKTWEDAAEAIRRTISGVGTFEFANLQEFLSSGPWTARQAVEKHLHWIAYYPDVYGTASAQRIFEASFR